MFGSYCFGRQWFTWRLFISIWKEQLWEDGESCALLFKLSAWLMRRHKYLGLQPCSWTRWLVYIYHLRKVYQHTFATSINVSGINRFSQVLRYPRHTKHTHYWKRPPHLTHQPHQQKVELPTIRTNHFRTKCVGTHEIQWPGKSQPTSRHTRGARTAIQTCKNLIFTSYLQLPRVFESFIRVSNAAGSLTKEVLSCFYWRKLFTV